MGKVTISPPYRPDNVKGVSDSKAVMHVRKIVSQKILSALISLLKIYELHALKLLVIV